MAMQAALNQIQSARLFFFSLGKALAIASQLPAFGVGENCDEWSLRISSNDFWGIMNLVFNFEYGGQFLFGSHVL